MQDKAGENVFEEGAILYFRPFVFPNGATPKPKYFIILKKYQEKLLLASLPTSKDSVPSFIDKTHGCIDLPEINFNCYYFEGGKHIAKNPANGDLFAFPVDTYVYGFRIDLFDRAGFIDQQNNDMVNISVKGQLYLSEFGALIRCLKSSASVKRKYRAIL